MASDFAFKIPAELEAALRLNSVHHYVTKRPWLDLYGINVRPVAPFGSTSRKAYVDPALLHRYLPDELLFEVCYYRYMRFFPSGRFLYKNSSLKVKDVAKIMNIRAAKADSVFSGHYTLSDDKVEAAVLYPGMRPTVLRIRLRLRGTTTGANNRMDLLSLVTSGVNDSEVRGPDEDILGVVEGWQDDETHNPDVPAVSHKRGLTPFVFIPFEEVETSFLNLPVEKMDYFVPG